MSNIQSSWRRSKGRVQVEGYLVGYGTAKAGPAVQRKSVVLFSHRAIDQDREAAAWMCEGKTPQGSQWLPTRRVYVRLAKLRDDLVNTPGRCHKQVVCDPIKPSMPGGSRSGRPRRMVSSKAALTAQKKDSREQVKLRAKETQQLPIRLTCEFFSGMVSLKEIGEGEQQGSRLSQGTPAAENSSPLWSDMNATARSECFCNSRHNKDAPAGKNALGRQRCISNWDAVDRKSGPIGSSPKWPRS